MVLQQMTDESEHLVVGLILNWRDPQRTSTCIHSLLNEAIDHVMVWDNSQDEGANYQSLTAAFHENARVSIVESPINLGFAAGINRALSLLSMKFQSPWVLVINNDAVLAKGGLEILRESLTQNSKAHLAYPRINHNGRILGTMYYHRLTGLLSDRPFLGAYAYASGCCFLLALDRLPLPLFDEEFFMYGEDWELGWRYRQTPEKLLHVPEMLVFHEGSSSSKLGSPFYESRLVAGHLLLTKKLTSKRLDCFLLLSCRIATLSLRAIIRSMRFRSLTPIRALWQGAAIARAGGMSPSL